MNGRGCNRGRGEGPEGRCTPGEVWDGVHAPRVRKALACGAPGSGRGSRWHSKGGRLCHVYMARAPARSQPEAAARSNVPTCLRTSVKLAGALRGGQAGGAGALRGRGCVVCAGGVAVYAGEGWWRGGGNLHGKGVCVGALQQRTRARHKADSVPRQNTARPWRRPSTPFSVPSRSARKQGMVSAGDVGRAGAGKRAPC